MHLELTGDQELFRDTTRRFLDDRATLADVRALYESPEGFDRPWWRQAAALGWTSLFVPERLGGGSLSGRPVADAVIVAEEMGRSVAPDRQCRHEVVGEPRGHDRRWQQRDAALHHQRTAARIAPRAGFRPRPSLQPARPQQFVKGLAP